MERLPEPHRKEVPPMTSKTAPAGISAIVTEGSG